MTESALGTFEPKRVIERLLGPVASYCAQKDTFLPASAHGRWRPRLGAEHAYGAGCYAPDGSASIIAEGAEQIDARKINPTFPATFPRLVQHAVWMFYAAGGHDVCNGARIDDRGRCGQVMTCPSYAMCDRVCLGRK